MSRWLQSLMILELDGGDNAYTAEFDLLGQEMTSNSGYDFCILTYRHIHHRPPLLAVTLQAEPGNTSKIQLGLFSPPLPEAARLDVTVAQLKVFLEKTTLAALLLQDSHATREFYD